MQLLTLNLHKPLLWRVSETGGIHSIEEAIQAAAQAPDGSETAISWPWEDIVDESGDGGPHARRPLPPPALIAGSGPDPRREPTSAPACTADEVRLPEGRYLFMQTRLESVEALAEAIDSFSREAWWTKAGGEGPLVVRFVSEDGKTAAQIIRALAATTASPI